MALAILSLGFFYLLVKINSSINNAELQLNAEISRHKLLTDILIDLKENTPPNPDNRRIKYIDSLRALKDKRKHNISPGKAPDSVVHKPVDRRNNDSVSLINNTLLREEFYTYKFDKPIRISKSTNVVQLSCILTVKYDAVNKPKEVHGNVSMKEADEDAHTVTPIVFHNLKSQVYPDNTVKCVLQEAMKPDLDSYGFPSYQRHLSITLSGSLKEPELDELLTWEEVSGRPAYARFKIPLLNNQHPPL